MNPNPRPVDRSISRAERRRQDRGIGEEQATGKVGCRHCMSTVGTYTKADNHFKCETKDCKGNR